MIKLRNLIELISNDKEIDTLDITEQLDIQTYYYLVEVLDLTNIYPFQSTDKFSAEFIDNNKIKHFIRIAFQPLNEPRFDLKFGFYDENGKPSFKRPNLHYDLNPDEKIFNTHIHILINKFLEEDKFFEKIKDKSNKLYLPAIDVSRYRLFRLALNKLLDKKKYKFYDDKHKNTIVIEPT
jgi:hypothetical protein